MTEARLAVDRKNLHGAKTVLVHDGDTVIALIWDEIIQIYVQVACRIRGIQAPELTDPGGTYVRDVLARLLPRDTPLVLSDMRPYPRPGHVTCGISTPDGTDLAAWLLQRQLAVPWDGRGARPSVPWPPPVMDPV